MSQPTNPYLPGNSHAYQQQPTEDHGISAETAPHTSPEAGAPRRKRTGLIIAIAVVVLALLAAGIFVGARYFADQPLADAQKACDPDKSGTVLADGGATLLIDTKGERDARGASVAEAVCVLKSLKATAAVIDHMDSTRALDGRQTDSWGKFQAAWTYHPNDGFDLAITAK